MGNIDPAQTGLGNINPALYRLAQATTDVFHDIAVGDNEEPCSQGSPACVNGLAGYTAGPNYDRTTGLGSVDVYNLVMEWNSGTASSTTLTASPGTAGLNDTVELIATVTAGSGSAAPTGDVAFVVNGISAGTRPWPDRETLALPLLALVEPLSPSVTASYPRCTVATESSPARPDRLPCPFSPTTHWFVRCALRKSKPRASGGQRMALRSRLDRNSRSEYYTYIIYRQRSDPEFKFMEQHENTGPRDCLRAIGRRVGRDRADQ